MRASQPSTGGCREGVPFLASIWVVGPVKDTQCGFKGFRREAAHDLFARQQITSIVFDVELISWRASAATRWPSVQSVGPTSAVRGWRASSGLAIRVAWDPSRIPLVHRRVGRIATAATHDGA